MENLEKLQQSIQQVAKAQIEAFDFDLSGIIQDRINKMCEHFNLKFTYQDWRQIVSSQEVKNIEQYIVDAFQKKVSDKIINDMLEQITPIEEEDDLEDHDYGHN